jgi:hypothetical protein
MEDEMEKTTWRDVGRGMMLLGGAALLLTAIFFILAMWDNKYYGLFSGTEHLVFYTVLGLAFLAIGFFLAKRNSAEADRPKDAGQD